MGKLIVAFRQRRCRFFAPRIDTQRVATLFEKMSDRHPVNPMAAFVQAHGQLAQEAALGLFPRSLAIVGGLRLDQFEECALQCWILHFGGMSARACIPHSTSRANAQLSQQFKWSTANRSFAQTSQMRAEPVAAMADT